jgi:hypothetical protein
MLHNIPQQGSTRYQTAAAARQWLTCTTLGWESDDEMAASITALQQALEGNAQQSASAQCDQLLPHTVLAAQLLLLLQAAVTDSCAIQASQHTEPAMKLLLLLKAAATQRLAMSALPATTLILLQSCCCSLLSAATAAGVCWSAATAACCHLLTSSRASQSRSCWRAAASSSPAART